MTERALKPGWTWVKFGDVVHLNTNRIADPEAEGIERYVGIEHIEPEDLRIRSWGLVEEGTSFTNYFKSGQILFVKRRAYQRKVALAEFEGVCSGDIYVLEPQDDRLLPDLLPFICQTEAFFAHAVNTSAGSLSPRTNWKQLAEYEFALPPLAEQWRIAKALSQFEELSSSMRIASQRFGILELALMKELFQVKGKVGWKEAEFSEVDIQIIDGDRGRAYPSRSQLFATGFCVFLNASNVTRRGFDFTKCEFIDQERDSLLRKGKLKREDVVLTTRGTLGNVAHYDSAVPYEHLRINSGMVIFRTDPATVDPRFLYWVLRSPYFTRLIEKSRSGTAQPQLPIRALNQFRIPIPPLERQRQIAGFLDTVEETGTALENRKAEAQVCFKSFLSSHLSNSGGRQ